jgi:putative oxidoreductase
MPKPSFLFPGTSLDSDAAHAGWLILRVFTGLALALAHGLGKIPPSDGFISMIGNLGMPAPALFAWLSGIAEFVGGLLLAIGLFTRLASLFIVGNMTVAVLMAHAGDSFSDREKALLFLVIGVAFLLAGPGRYAVDALIRRR